MIEGGLYAVSVRTGLVRDLHSGPSCASPGLYHTVLDGLIQIRPGSQIPKFGETHQDPKNIV